jgi:hypothetical protein
MILRHEAVGYRTHLGYEARLRFVHKGLPMGRSPIQGLVPYAYKYDSKTREMGGLLNTLVCRVIHEG